MGSILTLKQLKEMKPDTIIASGYGPIEHPWFNNARFKHQGGTLELDGRSTIVRWVAVRGGIHDWAIYHSMDANIVQADYFDDPSHILASIETIIDYGAKLRQVEAIRRFVPCDDEALAMYRG